MSVMSLCPGELDEITNNDERLGNIMTFEYHINVDERGSFFADVRDESGETVLTIKAGNELEEGESSIFEDGFMKHKGDMDGLHEYLEELGIANDGDKLIAG